MSEREEKHDPQHRVPERGEPPKNQDPMQHEPIQLGTTMKKSSQNTSLKFADRYLPDATRPKNILAFPGHPSDRIRAGVRAALAKISYRTQSVLSRSFDFSPRVLPDENAVKPMEGEVVQPPSDEEIDSALRALRGHVGKPKSDFEC